MKLLKNNLAKFGVMALAVCSLGGSIFAATQMQGNAASQGKTLEVADKAAPITSEEMKPGDFIGYAMGTEENIKPQAMIMGEDEEIVYRDLTEEEAKELENTTNVEAGAINIDLPSDKSGFSFVMDGETGKVTEGMSKELVGGGIYSSTGLNGEEVTAQYMEIKEDGTVIMRALTQEEKNEFGLNSLEK